MPTYRTFTQRRGTAAVPSQARLPLARTAAATLLTLSAMGALLLVSPRAHAQQDTSPAAAWRATSRLGYGPTPQSAQDAQAGARRWALQQIDAAYAASQAPANIPADIARFNEPVNQIASDFHAEREARRTKRQNVADTAAGQPATATAAATAAAQADAEGFSREMQQGALAWRLMACSNPAIEQPLLAKMTEFWFNHLNVFTGKGTVRPFVGSYVVSAIRPHALGKFEDLLLASAHHPAMLFYLDQAQSNVRGINENYARELMELHTLGVNTGYSQNDVRELARILTGWTVPLPRGEGFSFAPRLHDTGDKVLLGRTFHNEGEREGDEAIRMLAREPATARRISLRLAQTFVADKPPQVLVDKLTSTFLATQGDIRAVMRTLVASPEFWKADNTLFKTPLDFACSALTAAGGASEKRELQLTLGFLSQAGQPMHGWQTPDGYKTDTATWLAPEALTRRADYALALGARMPEPVYLQPFLSASSRDRIASEPAGSRTGLTLASPDFMSK